MNFWIYCVAAHCFCQQEVLSEMFSRGRWDGRLSKMNIKLPELEDSLPTPMMISNSQMIKKAQGILWDRRVSCRLFQTFKGHASIVHRQHALERRDHYYCQLNGLWLHGHLTTFPLHRLIWSLESICQKTPILANYCLDTMVKLAWTTWLLAKCLVPTTVCSERVLNQEHPSSTQLNRLGKHLADRLHRLWLVEWTIAEASLAL